MRDLTRIEAAYNRLDLVYEGSLARTDLRERMKLAAEQVLNDHAYFLLCWGQLETEINEACRSAIRSRIGHQDWQVRRSWYLYNPDDKRLSGLAFEARAALVLDRDAGRSSPWAKTMFHYAVRNEIAHGALRSTRINISAFMQDCYAIQSALHRAA